MIEKFIKKRQRPQKHPATRVLIAIFFITVLISQKVSSHQNVNLPKFQESQSVSTAISDVIREFFIANDIKFDFIVYGESSSNINDIVDRVMNEASRDTVPTTLRHIKDIHKWNHELNQSAVMFVKRQETVIKLHEMTRVRHVSFPHLTNPTPKAFKFLIYVEEIETFDQLNEVITRSNVVIFDQPPTIRYFELFVTSNATAVNLFANQLIPAKTISALGLKFMPVLVPKRMNSFDQRSQQWTEKLRNFEHFSNFNGCILSFLVQHFNNFYIEDPRNFFGMMQTDEERFKDLLGRENLKIAGPGAEIIQEMAQRSNFTAHYKLVKAMDINFTTYNTRNLDLSPLFTLWFPIQTSNDHEGHLSAPLGSVEYYYLITLNDVYSNYEKLLLPFDATTWTLLLLTFGLTFAIILGLQLSPQRIREVVLGRGVTHPGFNAVGIFFGVGQLRLPTEMETFSRSILLLFIWFCLIFRTCYQSMIFEYMTSDMRKPLPETIDDIREMNYTIVVPHEFTNEFPNELYKFNEEIINGRQMPNIQYTRIVDVEALYEKAVKGDAEFKMAFFVSSLVHAKLNSTHKLSLPVMHNEKLTKMVVVYMRRNNVLLQQLNQVISQLIPSGILQHLQSYGLWYLVRPFDVEIEDPRRILSMSDLEFGFVLWLIACFISFLCFVCELWSLNLKRHLRSLIGLFDFIRLLRARMLDYHDRW